MKERQRWEPLSCNQLAVQHRRVLQVATGALHRLRDEWRIQTQLACHLLPGRTHGRRVVCREALRIIEIDLDQHAAHRERVAVPMGGRFAHSTPTPRGSAYGKNAQSGSPASDPGRGSYSSRPSISSTAAPRTPAACRVAGKDTDSSHRTRADVRSDQIRYAFRQLIRINPRLVEVLRGDCKEVGCKMTRIGPEKTRRCCALVALLD